MEWEPQLVSGGHTFQALALTYPKTCGLTEDGEILCWGGEAEILEPAPIDPGEGAGDMPFTALVPGFCALGTSGQAYCWGSNGHGQVGDGTSSGSEYAPEIEMPMAVASPGLFSRLGEKNFHTCGIATDGFAYCWGANDSGELGNGTTQDSAVPVKVSGQ
jgi:alpha-tubulin suppressor-like RCC1 family protein